MKSQVWYIIQLQSIVRLSNLKRARHLLEASSLTGQSRRLLQQNGESSRETLLGEAIEANRRVPNGHLAVYVGPEVRRFVIPASFLAMPEFRMLMDRVAEEFGFEHQGGLHIPCEEAHFEEILSRCIESKGKRRDCEHRKGSEGLIFRETDISLI